MPNRSWLRYREPCQSPSTSLNKFGQMHEGQPWYSLIVDLNSRRVLPLNLDTLPQYINDTKQQQQQCLSRRNNMRCILLHRMAISPDVPAHQSSHSIQHASPLVQTPLLRRRRMYQLKEMGFLVAACLLPFGNRV